MLVADFVGPPMFASSIRRNGSRTGTGASGGTDDRTWHQDNTFQDALPQAVICQAGMFRPQVADLKEKTGPDSRRKYCYSEQSGLTLTFRSHR
jgi:hypothetical protein